MPAEKTIQGLAGAAGYLCSAYDELSAAGLAFRDADRLADITRCPGADTCQLALTHSRGLAAALGDIFVTEFSHIPEVQQISVKISGCMNSCGQHHIADIGFYGASEDAGGHQLPSYVLMLAGRTEIGRAHFGKVAGKIPARWIPEAVRKMLGFYVDEHAASEPFGAFVNRIGVPRFKELLDPLMRIPTYENEPELFYDLGADEKEFKAEIGVGECAG